MPTDNFRVQMTRGTTDQNDAYVGQPGELTLDLDKNEFRVHDGVNVGGKKFGGRPGNVVDGYELGGVDLNSLAGAEWVANGGGFDNVSFGPTTVDGDICYMSRTDFILHPSYATDPTVGGYTLSADPNYVPEIAGHWVADVTNGRAYDIKSSVQIIPKHLQDIMFADIGDYEGILWVSADNPGKLTTVDPLASHGINCKDHVFRSLELGLLPMYGFFPRSAIAYTAKEGEDISIALNMLLKVYKNINLYVPLGVSCVIERLPVSVTETRKLVIHLSGRIDVTVRSPRAAYLTSGPWYQCSGFDLYGCEFYIAGAGEIHHHILPGTKLYPVSSSLVNIVGYRPRPSFVNAIGIDLDIYQTIGTFGHSKGGSVANFYIAGVNFHEERRSPAVANVGGPGAYIFNQTGWSHAKLKVSLALTAVTVVGGFTPMPNDGTFFDGGIANTLSSAVIT